jgi:peptide deformylase
MPARRIRQLGDPVLRSVSSPAASAGEARPVLRDLRATLTAFRREHGFGRGISAVQIGEPKRIIYIEFEGTAYCLVNPELEAASRRTFRLWDDCFSFPNLMVYVERAWSVAVRYQDQDWKSCRLEAAGALAELLQHEMDHLDGILAIDRAVGRDSFATREEYLRRFAASARAATPSPASAS